MKIKIQNYSFNPTLKQITFLDYSSIQLNNILLITDVTVNNIIYNFASPAYGGSVSGNILTLDFNVTAFNSTDSLQIFYESDTNIDATNGILSWMKSVLYLLKPLSIVTGGGDNRLSVNVNAVAAVTTVTTVTTVASVTAVQNQVNMGNVSAFTLQQATLRNAFANGIRTNIV